MEMICKKACVRTEAVDAEVKAGVLRSDSKGYIPVAP